MGDTAPQRRGGGWHPRSRGRGFYRGNGPRQGSSNSKNGTSIMPVNIRQLTQDSLESQSVAQMAITDMMEISAGPYNGWKLYHKQEAEQRKRRGPNWGEAETIELLRLWAERFHDLKFIKRNGFLMDEIAEQLKASNFMRSRGEVKTRIANLTQEYRMEARRRSLGYPRGSFKLWDAVDAILGSDESSYQQQSELQPSEQLNLSEMDVSGWSEPTGDGVEGPESLCCDIDPGALLEEATEEEEEEEEEEGEDPNIEEKKPEKVKIEKQSTSKMPVLSQALMNNIPALIRVQQRSKQVPTVPKSAPLQISYVEAIKLAAASNGMPALIMANGKRPSSDSTSDGHLSDMPILYGPNGMPARKRGRPSSKPKMVSSSNGSHDSNSCSGDAGLDPIHTLVLETQRANQIAEMNSSKIAILLQEQLKLQKRGLKMQKQILMMMKRMQPS